MAASCDTCKSNPSESGEKEYLIAGVIGKKIKAHAAIRCPRRLLFQIKKPGTNMMPSEQTVMIARKTI